MMRELHWSGIVFGAVGGLAVSLLLFAISGPIGTNIVGQLAIQFIGFTTAGFVAGRLSLVQTALAGRIAALLLLLITGVLTISLGADSNVLGLILLGALAIAGGTFGAAVAEKRRK